MDPELLQALVADPAGARRMLQAALAERAAGDPRMAALAQALARPEEEAAEPAPAPHARSGAVERVRRRVAEMRAELIALRERNADVADALGACRRCWGDDEACERCGGAGSPGWREPDPELFDELIQPAIERRSRAAGDTTQERRTR